MKNNRAVILVLAVTSLVALIVIFSLSIILFFPPDNKTDSDTPSISDGDTDVSTDLAPYVLKSTKGVGLIIEKPIDKDDVSCPIIIEGSVTGTWYFEAVFGVKILGDDNEELTSSFATAQDEWMTEDSVRFTSEIACDNCKGRGKLVFIKDNPTGFSEFDDSVSLDVTFNETCNKKDIDKADDNEQTQTMEIKVYFSNTNNDPDLSNCEVTYSTTRSIPQTKAVGRASINELLKGPSKVERSTGFITQIPDGVVLNSLYIENGVAYADFSEDLHRNVGGSCRVLTIRSQIENTLKQFPTVDEVKISINGNSEEVLQP